MSAKTITRADLCEAVYQKVGLSRTESATLVELVLKEITDCLQRGETVKLSSFGSFVVRKKGQRIGRNPKTGKEVPISPRRVMVFTPSAILMQRILREQGIKFVQAVWQPGAPQPSHGRGDEADFGADEVEAEGHDGAPKETERRRGLFGLLPTLLGDDAGERTTARAPAAELR